MNEEELLIEKAVSLYETIRKISEKKLDDIYNNTTEKVHVFGFGSSSFSVLTSQHRKVNFVKGNTNIESFLKILFKLELEKGDLYNFIDLGCGDGECLGATLLFNSLSSPLEKCKFSNLIGVDLQKQQLESAHMFLNELNDSLKTENPDLVLPEISVKHSDFLEINWNELLSVASRSVLYMCATCFTDGLILSIMKSIFPMLLNGSIIICLDKDLNEYYHNPQLEEFPDITTTRQNANTHPVEILNGEYEYQLQLVFFQTCRTSWGQGIAYVYRKESR